MQPMRINAITRNKKSKNHVAQRTTTLCLGPISKTPCIPLGGHPPQSRTRQRPLDAKFRGPARQEPESGGAGGDFGLTCGWGQCAHALSLTVHFEIANSVNAESASLYDNATARVVRHRAGNQILTVARANSQQQAKQTDFQR